MAIRWNWKDKIGEVIYKDGTKHSLYQGNALLIALSEHKNGTYTLAWFFADENHMKNMLGLTKDYKDNSMTDCKRIRLDVRYKSTPKIVSTFARAKMEIEIELYVGEEPQE